MFLVYPEAHVTDEQYRMLQDLGRFCVEHSEYKPQMRQYVQHVLCELLTKTRQALTGNDVDTLLAQLEHNVKSKRSDVRRMFADPNLDTLSMTETQAAKLATIKAERSKYLAKLQTKADNKYVAASCHVVTFRLMCVLIVPLLLERYAIDTSEEVLYGVSVKPVEDIMLEKTSLELDLANRFTGWSAVDIACVIKIMQSSDQPEEHLKTCVPYITSKEVLEVFAIRIGSEDPKYYKATEVDYFRDVAQKLGYPRHVALQMQNHAVLLVASLYSVLFFFLRTKQITLPRKSPKRQLAFRDLGTPESVIYAAEFCSSLRELVFIGSWAYQNAVFWENLAARNVQIEDAEADIVKYEAAAFATMLSFIGSRIVAARNTKPPKNLEPLVQVNMLEAETALLGFISTAGYHISTLQLNDYIRIISTLAPLMAAFFRLAPATLTKRLSNLGGK